MFVGVRGLVTGRLCETYTVPYGYKCRLNIICRPRSTCSRHPSKHRQHFYVTYPCIEKTAKHEMFLHSRHVYLAYV